MVVRRSPIFLANAEVGLAYNVIPALTLRGFAGLNYDGGVPGIAAPWNGPFVLFGPATPASIRYVSETSYYAGGGLKWSFGG